MTAAQRATTERLAETLGDTSRQYWTSQPMQTVRPCEVHKYHRPLSHINEVHHVWPLGDDGPDIAANKVVVCATGHNSIHDLLNAYRKVHGDPGWTIRRRYSARERELAALGWWRLSNGRMES